jgi:hypothetical protein
MKRQIANDFAGFWHFRPEDRNVLHRDVRKNENT